MQKIVFSFASFKVPIIHAQLAVRQDMSTVIQNNFIFKQWVELGAWQYQTWGSEFFDGLEPLHHAVVVRHSRKNVFFDSTLEEIIFKMKPKDLLYYGVSTAYAVESTVRYATDMGYTKLQLCLMPVLRLLRNSI